MNITAYSPLGPLVLLAGLVVVVIVMLQGNRRAYTEAMEKYAQAMDKYQEAIGAYELAARSLLSAPVSGASGVDQSSGEISLSGVDEPTAAMLIAIVCDAIGGNLADLQFVSVKAL
jgi:hypothetical protein